MAITEIMEIAKENIISGTGILGGLPVLPEMSN